MSLAVQNSNFRQSSMNTNTTSKKTNEKEKVFSKEYSTKQVSKTESIETLSPEEELEQFKAEFHEELSKINPHVTVDNLAINISEEAFLRMKDDPEYKEKILGLIQRDLGSSYAPRNCSIMITVGSTSEDYRADCWPVIADSEFDIRSQNSAYKRTKAKKKKQKELLEEYLEKCQERKRVLKELSEEQMVKDYNTKQALLKSDAEKAYNRQFYW